MAEPSSTATPKKKKAAKAEAPPPAPAPEAGLFTTWKWWAAFGIVLVGGVVGWKLIGSTYKGDVETICNAEKASGFTVAKDLSKVTQYVRAHLATPEGNQLFSALGDAKLADRAKRMKTEADTQKVGSCPIIASYEQVAAEGDYRGDLQHLCSSLTFPKLAELQDDARLAKLEGWIDQQAKSPRTKELAEPLRQGAPADRAKLLRETAGKLDIFTCDVAKTLEGPVVEVRNKGVPTVRPFAPPQINGVMPAEDLAKALVDVTPAMNDCYKKGLEKKADLQGKLAVKIKVDPTGKVTTANPAEASVPDREVTACILAALKGMKLPSNPGPLVTALIPLEMTTAGTEVSPGAAMSGH